MSPGATAMRERPDPAEDSIPLASRERIDSICDRIEAEWRAGRRPVAEEYLHELPGPEQSRLLLELLRVELDCRGEAGERPDPEQLRARFPEYSTVVDSLLRHEEDTAVAAPAPPRAGAPHFAGYEVLDVVGRGG